MKKRNSYFKILTLVLCVFAFSAHALEGNNGWSVKYQTPKVFIENKGQFHTNNPNEKVLYAYDDGSTMISFTSTGVTYSFLKRLKKEKKGTKAERKLKHFESGKSHAEWEVAEHKLDFEADVINFVWENANPNVEIVPEELATYHFSYNTKEKDGSEKNINYIKAFKRIIYKNLYPNIDVEYVFHPTDGLKYALIVHPGADISKVKMKYEDIVKLNDNGDFSIPTLFGDIVEHAPVTFYSENKSSIISSHFIKTDKTISFRLGEYDHNKTVIIDPWVQTPSISNSNSVWECERDAAGNVYIIGGDMPMKLIKYNAAGALQWTYNTTWDTANYWLGTFAVDLAGNSYVTSGTHSKISKVNNAGGNVWTNNSIGGSSQELWNITFNCDQTRLIIGGTSGLFTLNGSIFDLDVNNGNVVTNKIVGSNGPVLPGGVSAPNEVRSICSAQNGKYYFLTLDSIGRISQNFTACSSNSSLYKINSTYNFAYYNPSYRYNNAGIMAIRTNKNFLYTQNGSTLNKRALGSLAILASVTIPAGINVAGGFGNPGQVPGSSGLDIDTCGNLYVGSSTGVYKFDANLTQIGFAALPFTVFDVSVSTAGNVVAAGSTTQTSGTRTGYVQSIASFAACNPLALFCCDASFCPVASMCSTGSAVTLSAATPGGTWSGAGVNPATGVFNPATAGTGMHTIIYTLPCGSDSIIITVSACVTLTACQETNGDITATSGTAPYTWYNQTTTQDCSACIFGCAAPPGCAVNVTSWASFTTGTTATPPGTYPILFIDGAGDSLQITSLSSLPNCSSTCPVLTVTSSNVINDSCFGASTGSFSASTSGGVSPWDYTLVNGGGTTVSTFSNIAGTQNFTGLPAGTYTLNVLDNSSCPGTTTVTISQPPAATTAATAGADQSMCSNSATLAGNVPTVGTGIWTLVSGTGTITTPASSTSGVTGLGVGANVFEWTITNSPCPPSFDQVTITNTGGGAPAAAGPDQSVCSSSSILAGNVPSFGTGLWTLVSGTATITTPSSATSGISGLGIGVSVFEWTISNPPCPSTSDQITITNTGGGPTVTISSQTNVSCYGGNNGSVVASATGGAGSLTYFWTPTGGASASANNLMAGTYTISVADGNGCVGIETVAITQSDSIAATVTTTPAGCGSSDGSATVVASGGTGNLTYLWSNGGTQSQISNLSAQIYSVTITDDLGCTKVASGTVTSSGGPTASVGADVTINSGSSVLLSSSGGGTYFWAPPAGLDCDTCRTPTASPVVTTIYCVTVSDNGTCTDTACVTVTVADTVQVITCGTLYVPVGSVYVPSAFTPNNNDILNDVFKPVANCVHDYNFIVFNRWGEKLFETNDKDVGWNGIYKGSMSKPDVYVYKITFWDDPKNEFHQFIGKVTLLR